jgi:hypothetical protein
MNRAIAIPMGMAHGLAHPLVFPKYGLRTYEPDRKLSPESIFHNAVVNCVELCRQHVMSLICRFWQQRYSLRRLHHSKNNREPLASRLTLHIEDAVYFLVDSLRPTSFLQNSSQCLPSLSRGIQIGTPVGTLLSNKLGSR